ncbi:hypothetical protein HYZ41_00660 [archaeon]|nr:hypothetical protein [archaeon]
MTYETRYKFKTIHKRLGQMGFNLSDFGVENGNAYIEYRNVKRQRITVTKSRDSKALEIYVSGTDDLYKLSTTLGLK